MVVIADPATELLGLVMAGGDPAPCHADAHEMARARLIRRRFSLALPPPFVELDGSADIPLRMAVPHDGAAISSVKWRTFGTSYRGVFPDDFLDNRAIVPPATFWTGRAMVPPSRHHRLMVWGRPGTVLGYLDCGPAQRDDDPGSSRTVGEIYELYVDPCCQGRGGGARLLAAGVDWLRTAGFDRAELHTVATNYSAQAFYAAHGWVNSGERLSVDLGVVAFEELILTKNWS